MKVNRRRKYDAIFFVWEVGLFFCVGRSAARTGAAVADGAATNPKQSPRERKRSYLLLLLTRPGAVRLGRFRGFGAGWVGIAAGGSVGASVV